MDTLQCYIPKNFEATDLDGYNPQWHDKFNWVINSILFKSLTNKNDFAGWVNLNSQLLNKFIGSNYRNKVLTILNEACIIEVNNSYSTGAFSKGYRLREKYRSSGIKAVPIRKRTFQRKVEKHRQEYLKDILNNNSNIRHEFMQLHYSRIDKNKALKYINDHYAKDSDQYKSRLIAIEQYDAMHKTQFADGRYQIDYTFKVTKGRVYSPATMLARDLEQFTYFDGEHKDKKVVNIDMPNSQLLFYDLCISRATEGLNNIGSNSYKEERNNKIRPNRYFNNNPLSTTPYVIENAQRPLPLRDTDDLIYNDKYSWQDVIYNIKGYERLMYLSKWEGSRNDFKPYFYGNLFYNKYSDRLTDLEIVFNTYYPNEFNKLRSIKKRLGNKAFAVEVHTLEGYFFHTIVVKHMRTNYIDVPFTIKHDSIAVPEDAASYIYPEINKLAREFFNRPEIKLRWEVK